MMHYHNLWYLLMTYLSRKRLLNPEKLPRTSLWDVLQHIWQNFKQIDVYISPIHIELYTIQTVMCHPGHISRNKNARQVLKKSKGRPYETSCNIFCNSFKQNYVYKSPKHIELFTIQAVMCHTDDILRNKSDLRILNKSQGRAYFMTVLNKLTLTHLPKTFIYIYMNYVQYRFFCVTQATYRAIKGITESWKSPKDVLIRCPATYFVTVLNKLTSTILLKNIELYTIQAGMCHTGNDNMKTSICFKLLQNMLQDVS